MFKIVVLVLAFSSFCKRRETQPLPVDLVNQTNHAEIIFFKGKQPCVYKTSRKIDLIYLKDLILKARNKSDLKCDSTGAIIYFKDKTQLLKVYFSSGGTGSKYKNTSAITFNIHNQKTTALFNYGAGMLVNEEYYQLQKH